MHRTLNIKAEPGLHAVAMSCFDIAGVKVSRHWRLDQFIALPLGCMANQTKCADSPSILGLGGAKSRRRQVADKNEVSLFEASKWRRYLDLWPLSRRRAG